MSDPVLSGFMKKYGGQRATDRGPLCPLCGRVVTRETAFEWYGPQRAGERVEPIRHDRCVRAARRELSTT